MEEFNAAGVPFCTGCRHFHFGGEKCSICGHVGKCNIWGKMLDKAKAHQSMTYWRVGSGLPYGCDMSEESEQWAILRELRGVIYRASAGDTSLNTNTNGTSDGSAEFNIMAECSSRHMLGSLGDKPILAIRYQLHFIDNGDYACVIDRFNFLPGYDTRQGLGHQCVSDFLQDVQYVLQQHRLSASTSSGGLEDEMALTSAAAQGGQRGQGLHTHPQNGHFFMQIPVVYSGVITTLQQVGFAMSTPHMEKAKGATCDANVATETVTLVYTPDK